MPTALTPHLAPPERTAEQWRSIEAAVTEACLLRAEGREAEAIAIVQGTLPAMISGWSRGAGIPSEQCQTVLRELFARVQQQVATATICKRLVLQSIDSAAVRHAPVAAPVQLRRRVPLDDIPGMLDALDEDERAATFRRQNFPSNARRPHAALALA
jgi:hypothetical protein